MTAVMWFDGSTNQRHSAFSIPHFTFRIPQFTHNRHTAMPTFAAVTMSFGVGHAAILYRF